MTLGSSIAPTPNRLIAVAMSGGVDSSVAAGLLIEQGETVIGLMLRLWGSGPSNINRCCSPEDVKIARQVAAHLSLPLQLVDVQDLFKKVVVDNFIDGYAQGITPNPCIACNRHIRWGALTEVAHQMGATHLATGHYARIQEQDDRFLLLRGVDQEKDQSYVLSVLNQKDLAYTLFPLGNLTKGEVREHAHRMALPVAEKPESQDLCFVPNGDYRDFLRQQKLPLLPGPILTQEGESLGEHRGLADYTIGQRRGLGISASYPLYVLDKITATNTLIVGPRSALGRDQFVAGPVNWIQGDAPDELFEVGVQVRYKSQIVLGSVELLQDGYVDVKLGTDLPDITPGQSAVFYHGEICLGGGVIQS
ncbi:MAG: thiouridylase [Anaerolineae bacterium SM23_ 63]|nr:MAG: thiouridylase [Anaerolineae bacterium SM23_ 63]HEY47255.1 tRNA 2-thiouridine(34) synthase MnmA [Anaerolineae bacterium]